MGSCIMSQIAKVAEAGTSDDLLTGHLSTPRSAALDHSKPSPQQNLSLDRLIDDMTPEELLAALLLCHVTCEIDHLSRRISIESEHNTIAWYLAERIIGSFGDRVRPALIKSKLLIELVDLLRENGRLDQ